jgi:hypothetical protein
MKAVVCAAMAMAAVASSACAETWSAAYGGTIVATYTDGRAVKVLVDADHTFAIVPPQGDRLTGTWKDEAGQSCFTITAPAAAAGGAATCVADKDFKVGDGFDGKDGTGAFHAVINAGR